MPRKHHTSSAIRAQRPAWGGFQAGRCRGSNQLAQRQHSTTGSVMVGKITSGPPRQCSTWHPGAPVAPAECGAAGASGDLPRATR